MRERFDYQRLARIEVSIKAAMSEAGVLHEIGNADAMGPFFTELDRSFLHDPRVSLDFVFAGIPHENPMVCFKSYNDVAAF
jgi:hypothetical protein